MPPAASNGGADEHHIYYTRHYPCAPVEQLIDAGLGQVGRREFALELEGGIYTRYQTADGVEGLRALLGRAGLRVVHLGGTYGASPQSLKRTRQPLVPLERELLLEIDANDYDGISRESLADCDAAWPLIVLGIDVVRDALRELCGFEFFFHAYSGRRGIHLSVHDRRACMLEDAARSALIAVLQPAAVSGDAGRAAADYSRVLQSPCLQQLFEAKVLPFWKSHGLKPRTKGGMGLLDGPLDRERAVELWGSAAAKGKLAQLNQCRNGRVAWMMLEKVAEELRQDAARLAERAASLRGSDEDAAERTATASKMKRLEADALKNVTCHYLWPRLDAGVSKAKGHCGKLVFSPHAKTGRLAVPLRGDELASYDPATTPTVLSVVEGEREALARFADRVAVLQDFAKVLTTRTEAEKAHDPPSFDFRMCAVSTGLARATQLAYNLKTWRVAVPVRIAFCAQTRKGDALTVQVRAVMRRAEDGEDFSVPPGYAAPSGAASFPEARFVRAVKDAVASPESCVHCATSIIYAIFPEIGKGGCRDVASAVAQFLHDLDSKAMETTLATLAATWDESAIASALKTAVADLFTKGRLVHGPWADQLANGW
jgi:DNA primase small subunit